MSSLIIVLLVSFSLPVVVARNSLKARMARASLVTDKSNSAKEAAFHDAMRKLGKTTLHGRDCSSSKP
jgi:hypothetical protein